jgi:hypothetical protein
MVHAISIAALGLGHAQTIEVKADPEKQALRMPWKNCIAVGRANKLLRADLLEQLAWLQKQIGYRYCRFIGVIKASAKVERWEHVAMRP